MTVAGAERFPAEARRALADKGLQSALRQVPAGFIDRRAAAREALPEFDDIRDAALEMKDHTLANLDLYLEAFEANARAAGSEVHWAETPAEARRILLDICRRVGARTVTKGKSMVSEEIGLNAALESAGIQPVETDLGEYIIQLRQETPSHIIAPAIHVSRAEVEKTFRRCHADLDPDRQLPDPASLQREARLLLREKYFAAEVGITGANFLVAETGETGLVTNEGNGDLVQSLARVHVVLAGIEKLVPSREAATAQLRILARSATGQEMSVYTTFSRGRRRSGDPDGPLESHVVLLDNGRSRMLSDGFREALRCIRCGACLNHCPVYQAVGGHAYGTVYPGPIGAVVSPALHGLEATAHLPNASRFCGRCEEVCPMRIPLPRMMRAWRERAFSTGVLPARQRFAVRGWAWLARRPRLYGIAADAALWLRRGLLGRRGSVRRLPFAGGWTDHREFPLPEGRRFLAEMRRMPDDGA